MDSGPKGIEFDAIFLSLAVSIHSQDKALSSRVLGPIEAFLGKWRKAKAHDNSLIYCGFSTLPLGPQFLISSLQKLSPKEQKYIVSSLYSDWFNLFAPFDAKLLSSFAGISFGKMIARTDLSESVTYLGVPKVLSETALTNLAEAEELRGKGLILSDIRVGKRLFENEALKYFPFTGEIIELRKYPFAEIGES